MKKTIKKFVAMSMALVMVICSTSVVFALDKTDFLDSPKLTSGVWYSQIEDGTYYDLGAANSTVYDGETGMWFYTPSAGMSSYFSKSTSRRAYIDLMEYDSGSTNADETVRSYTGYFGKDTSNRYTVLSFTNDGSQNVAIESNNMVELYVKLYVEKNSLDTSRNVNAGILCYVLWVE